MFSKILFVLWLGLFVGSFVMFMVTPSKDFGFTAGLNRIMVFFGWQIAAGVVGFILWITSRNSETGGLGSWLNRLPAIAAALLFFAVLFLIVGTRLGKSPPQGDVHAQDPPKTTEPVTAPPPTEH